MEYRNELFNTMIDQHDKLNALLDVSIHNYREVSVSRSTFIRMHWVSVSKQTQAYLASKYLYDNYLVM